MRRLANFYASWKCGILALLLPVTSVVVAQPCARTASLSEEEIMSDPQVQTAAYELFKASRFGLDQKESAMWVTFKNGEFGFVRWPYSGEFHVSVWNGPLPECTVANVHTHPTESSEQPEYGDRALANGRQLHGISLPVYVLHKCGIWKVVPGNSAAIRVRQIGWVREFTRRMAKLQTR